MNPRMVSAGIVLVEIIFLSLVASARAEEPALSLERRLNRLVWDVYSRLWKRKHRETVSR